MPTLPQMQLPPPKDWDEFENLCFSLFKKIWNDEYAQRNGKKGNTQDGVDIFGKHNQDWVGLQCKGKEIWTSQKLTEKEVKDEIEKAKNFKPSLRRYIIVTTASRNAKIQECCRQITEEHAKINLFCVNVYSWEDICESLVNYHEILKLFYPDLFSTEVPGIRRDWK